MEWRKLIPRKQPTPPRVRPVVPELNGPEPLTSIQVEDGKVVGGGIGRFTRQKINGVFEIVDNNPSEGT
jgi:hypothetical protein